MRPNSKTGQRTLRSSWQHLARAVKSLPQDAGHVYENRSTGTIALVINGLDPEKRALLKSTIDVVIGGDRRGTEA